MDQKKPNFHASDFAYGKSKEEDDAAISKLLSPDGQPIYLGDCFSQKEFDLIEKVVLFVVQRYCQKNTPQHWFEGQACIDMFCNICDSFGFILLTSFPFN
ncbi:hypothetical protein PTTG_26753 [Puccinia triticina 1-1 BBBD Race 1]|uniref:Uncharacterized protein n=1 Tax=Puccinia triticina (isolate 1-1 / race 1 (BBBD)) TaxID=630390 RepID=A0A180GSY5_PUCT1|nr:hypothetical protein PTTG_26753 [Puccinia triticina 1-1 BBBD Race 1]